MAKPQAFDVTTTPPLIIMEHEQEGNDISDDYYNYDNEEFVSRNGCGCFRLFTWLNHKRSPQKPHNGESTAFIYHRSGDVLDNNNWLIYRFKRLKEFSELVAGPKWKNFIRKFSKKPRKFNSVFQYDPESYALNFNDNADVGDDDLMSHSFSTRFAPHSRSMSS